jgi:hypothetical protein
MSVGKDPFALSSERSLARPSAVQTSPLDFVCHGRRNELVDRPAAGDALTELARGHRKLLDLEDLDVARGNGLTRPRGDRDRNQAEDLRRLLPSVEHRPLIGAEDEHRVLELLVAEQVDRVGMVVEPHLRVRQVTKGQPCQLEPSRGIEHRWLVSRGRDHEDEQPVGAELAQRSLRQGDVSEVRRIERAAEDRCRQSVTVSSPISTSAPVFAPTARSASSRVLRSGGVPSTR